ncbi:hypothetical protein ACQKPE_13225 [Pseudomonas sp. NPDC089554]|uniref:hypothetical protein n=1 Tax=Pseudomonas sp. NPDC089554 TaxID=3390653 RepID=UPI003D081DE2
MNLLRPVALVLCMALSWLPGGVVQAAQPQPKAEVVQGKTVKPAVKAPVKAAAKPAAKPKPKPQSKTKPAAKNRASSKPLPSPKVDLSLPADMVSNLKPDVGDTPVGRKPLLPAMFPQNPVSDDSPFQLNGRLISNEMQLQMRNDSRRDVDGAAIDFEFRN